jgi:hypothetical protein
LKALLGGGRRRRITLLVDGLRQLLAKELQQLAEAAELLHLLLPKLDNTRGRASRLSPSK